jgi:adenylylsulfate kinase-like enzyme
MAHLVVLTGPIAAGKNTVAELLADLLTDAGRTVVVADVDEVAAMVRRPGAGAAGLWFAAHEAHGALVGQWMRSAVDVVIAVGPFHTADERAALTRMLPDGAAALWVVIDAPVSVTFARAQADPTRGLSRDPGFHQRAHQRFREHLPTIPADQVFDSHRLDAMRIATAIIELLGAR